LRGRRPGQAQAGPSLRRVLVVGRPNAGKTLFCLRFAEFLGQRSLELRLQDPEGTVTPLRASPDEARRTLVDPRPHTTLGLQGVVIHFPRGKGSVPVELVDSTGLVDTIHPDPRVRRAMAQTLEALRQAAVVLHVVDAAEAGVAGPAASLGEIDRQVSRFSALRSGYAVLANKMDLPWARAGLLKIRDEFPDRTVIPVSALEGQGFREVRAFVWERL
jgi:predicted GTPase